MEAMMPKSITLFKMEPPKAFPLAGSASPVEVDLMVMDWLSI